ncbi:hypothetical protein VKT23_015779 [Stygiomarasmius scandens]|uniref:Uncharacterized protein n=1 Tax=Marasmiellus scandens TaxID=2682957 RepID=A0ABR1J100_9AGAR
MGPGSRRDTLDDIFGDWNHRKRGVLPTLLLKRLVEALDAREKHTVALRMLTAALPEKEIQKWKDAVTTWERNPHNPSVTNPYEPTTKEKALKEVQRELAEEDERDTEGGKIHKVSANSMIVQGMALEEEKSALAMETQRLKESATDTQKTKVIERSTRLRRRIERFFDIQNLYIPRLGFIRREADEHASPEQPAHAIELMLPSSCIHSKIPVSRELCLTEFRLRLGEAHDALESLRRHLLLQDSVWRFRHATLLGQRNMTRSQQITNDVDKKIKLDSARYRRAYRALVLLAPIADDYAWQTALRKLQDSDIRSFKDNEDLDGVGHGGPPKKKTKRSKFNATFKPQGKKLPSWIWLTTQHHSRQDMAEGTLVFCPSYLC